MSIHLAYPDLSPLEVAVLAYLHEPAEEAAIAAHLTRIINTNEAAVRIAVQSLADRDLIRQPSGGVTKWWPVKHERRA